MKTTKLIIAVCVIFSITTSCVEKSDKYKVVVAQRDSILNSEHMLKFEFDQTLEVINEIELQFKNIRDAENNISLNLEKKEQKSVSKRNQLSEQINQIKDILDKNKEKIELLDKNLAKSGKDNKSLSRTIARLKVEINEKTLAIESLRVELENKNIIIDNLNTVVDTLRSCISDLNLLAVSQEATIAEQEKELNKVWYIIAENKELETKNIISGNGLFKSKSIMDKNFNNDDFIQSDLRNLNIIETNCKKPRLLSSHPKDSYTLAVLDNKMVNIEIINPDKFWSVTKYLIVRE